MIIDKFTPRQLNTDDDQRYLKAGDMIDAVNITFSDDGESSRIVLKNERGTQDYEYATVNDIVPEYAMTVIGSVSDVQRQRVYFFAASDVDNQDYDDIIYMLDMATELYSVVYRDPSGGVFSFLNFDPNSFIKADVLNRDVQRDGGLQTILYFTDNINPPRKINVDRAIAGDYNNLNPVQKPYALNSIKAAPTREPLFYLDTDTTFSDNNIGGKAFQFATQFIYDDGEESAISPYSEMMFVDEARVTGIDGAQAPVIFSSLREEFNVCVIDTRFRSGANPNNLSAAVDIPEVEEIRVLARENNDGAWFVIDEVPARANTTRRINNANVVVYNANSGQYRFYNDAAYRTVSSLQTDKLYDNVPRLARGQAVSGNRLVYSNYLEGYNNLGTPAVTITPQYLGDGTYSGNGGVDLNNLVTFITQDVTGVSDSVDDDGSIRVNFLEAFSDAANSNYQLEPSSQTVITFRWEPKGTVSRSDTSLVQLEGADSDGNRVCYGIGQSSLGSPYNHVDLNTTTVGEENKFTFTFIYTAEEGDTVSSLANAFALYVQDLQWTNQYTETQISLKQLSASQDQTGNGHTSTIATENLYQVDSPTIKQSWKFETISTGGSTYIQPYIYFMKIDGDDTFATYNSNVGGLFNPEEDETWWNVQYQSEAFTNSQNTPTYIFEDQNVIDEEAFSSESVNTQRSFKSGAMHEFAMVFYDDFLRNGPIIKLGNVYAEHVAERSASEGKGPVGMQFNFGDTAANNNLIPDWASGYKILYPGNSSFQSVFTGGVQNAFPASSALEDSGVTSAVVDENKRHIYVSIEGLESLQDNMSTQNKYQFSEGDKLRVTSYKVAGVNTIAQSSVSGIVEFDIVKTVTLEDDAKNPLRIGQYNAGDLVQNGKVGRFLVVQAPEVDGAVSDLNGNTIQYPGFDWNSITGTDYPYSGGAVSTATNYWKQECVVEIVTPRVRTTESLYYEITPMIPVGARREAGAGDYGPQFITSNGEMYFRPILISTNEYDSDTSIWSDDPSERIIKSIMMESDRFSDRRDRADWGKGRPHLPLTEGQERRRYSSLTYSEAIVDDLNTLYASSFNKNLSNFLDLVPSYGALNYIGAMGETLMGLQENKVSRISVDRQVIQSAGGNEVALGLSTSPFNVDIYFSGDYGCGDNPEAVLLQDGQVFFADVSRSAVCRLSSSQLYPISEKGTRTLFNTIFNNVRNAVNPRIVSGYSPDRDMYYITFVMGANSETVGYDVFGGEGGNGGWVSRYTFYPTCYSNQDNTMISTLWVDPNTNASAPYDQQMFWSHNGNAYNTFYGNQNPSDVTYVSKLSPSNVKTFDALSHEGNSNQWNVQSINTDLMGANDNAGTLAFDEREGGYYAYITRDPGGSKHLRMLGVIESSTADTITFQNRINSQAVPANAELMNATEPLTTLSTGAPELLVEGLDNATTVRVQAGDVNTAAASNGVSVIMRTPAQLDGDPVRGHYATIRLTNNSTAQIELYSVNTVLTISQLHHNRQQ
jgi:hypothetical protein